MKKITLWEQKMFEISDEKFSILMFVQNFETLKEILERSKVVWLLDVGVDLAELLEVDGPHTLGVGASKLFHHLQGRVQVQTSEDVAQVEEV